MGRQVYCYGSFGMLCPDCHRMMLFDGYPSWQDGEASAVTVCGSCNTRYRVVLPCVFAEKLKGAADAVDEKYRAAADAWRGSVAGSAGDEPSAGDPASRSAADGGTAP